MEPRLSLVTLGVRDLRRAVRFYRDLLGWPAHYAEGDPIAFVPLNGIVLGLFGRQALAHDAGCRPRGSGFRGVTLAYNTRSRREVDQIFTVLRRARTPIVKPPRRTEWGGYSGYFTDPDGHLWEVAHNPFWKLDARGGVHLPGRPTPPEPPRVPPRRPRASIARDAGATGGAAPGRRRRR